MALDPGLIARLAAELGTGAVLTAALDIAPFAEDWRGRYQGNAGCVVLPSSTQQVAAAVRACAEAGVPIVPQGGNTSLCEGAVPASGGAPWVVLGLARMNRIRSVDVPNNSMTMDAGCVLAAVHTAASAHDRLYPISLGAEGSCQIGGTIATNAGGTGVIRYGNTRDNVLGLEVVLPDGRVLDGLRGLRKDNTGFDLKQLFIGSEGTLGVITGATIKLHPRPRSHATSWMAVPSPQAALDMLGLFQTRAGGELSSYEMLNKLQLDIVVQHVASRRAPVAVDCPWHVLVELSGTGSEASLDEALQEVVGHGLAEGLVVDAVVAASMAQRDAWWAVRHGVTEGNRKAGMGINTDVAVPVSAVPVFIERATEAARRVLPGAPIIVVAHLGDGNVHFIPQAGFDQWASWADPDAKALAVKHAVNEVAHALGGTFSAEHGIGNALTDEMAKFKPPVALDLMRAIKQSVDPRDLFNPGRVLPAARAGLRGESGVL